MKIKHVTSILFICLFLLHLDCFSQTEKKIRYEAIVVLKNNTKPLKGFIQKVDNSTLELNTKNNTKQINAEEIDRIRIRRFKNVGRCAAIGGGIGAGTGIILGAISGDDNPDNLFAMTAVEKSFVAGLFLGLIGTGVGSLIGIIDKEQIRINSDVNNFLNQKTRLEKYIYEP